MDKEDLPEAASAGRTIKNELESLRKMYPRKSGPRLSNASSPKSAANAVLWVLLNADDSGDLALHKTLFHKKKPMSASAWADFFDRKVFNGSGSGTPSQRKGILRGSIIPGTNMRGSHTYDVQAVVGYALQRSIPSAILANWNQIREAGR